MARGFTYFGSGGGGAALLDQENTWTELQSFEGLPAVPDVHVHPRDLIVGQIADPDTDWGPGITGGTLLADETPLGGLFHDSTFETPDLGAAIIFDTRWSTLLLTCPEPGGVIQMVTGLDPETGLFDANFGWFHRHQNRYLFTAEDGFRIRSAADQAGAYSSPSVQGTGGGLELGEMVASPDTPRNNIESGYCRVYAEDNGSGKTRLRVKWDDQTVSTILTQP
jgi:hypothetical protein